MKEKLFIIRIFDGQYTYIYEVYDTDMLKAENKALKYHKAFNRAIIKLTTTQIV